MKAWHCQLHADWKAAHLETLTTGDEEECEVSLSIASILWQLHQLILNDLGLTIALRVAVLVDP